MIDLVLHKALIIGVRYARGLDYEDRYLFQILCVLFNRIKIRFLFLYTRKKYIHSYLSDNLLLILLLNTDFILNFFAYEK